MLADLHVHTNYSHDSRVTMEEYAIQGIDKGIDIICFTDHLDCHEFYDTRDIIDFDKRAEEFHRVKAKYSQHIKLLLGVEFGEPHLHPQLHQEVLSMGLDMIIGSIHYPLDLQLLGANDTNRRYYERMYDQYVADLLECGGFDVLAHIDMPKRYNDDYVANLHKQKELISTCVAKGIIPEVNTSSIRKRQLSPMPDMELVQYYASIGGKHIVVNSDSHRVMDLGADLATTISTLPTTLTRCYFEQRQLIELP